ncbi:hypothetical protein HanIR_Chr02g0097731 [Helianthus annuus]|nr:hypothetical protein HanIR_Chr02g0097731 [Helianthus annuus]
MHVVVVGLGRKLERRWRWMGGWLCFLFLITHSHLEARAFNFTYSFSTNYSGRMHWFG